MLKALREAKRRTSWIRPNKEYEEATVAFLRRILAEPKNSPYWNAFFAFLEPIARIGMLNGLGQTLLKITAPGVPDFYQGTESWTFSLVDPDNRGAVDFNVRRRMLDATPLHPNRKQARELLEEWKDGRIKTATTRIALGVRRARRQAFSNGKGYAALEISGNLARHAVAFEYGGCVTLVPRLVAPLLNELSPFPLGQSVWGQTRLTVPARIKGRRLRNAFTGESLILQEQVALAEIFNDFPVALLVPD
jgi:(1->4)-alpha-D-glucan 1-alpha-D-glucosylmutase